MSHNLPHRPAPGPDCARYALLLPLLDADELTTTEAAAVRQHTDGCPWCQQELADYATVDRALRLDLGALMATAPIQSEETIMSMFDRDESDTVHMTDTSVDIKLNRAKLPARGRRVSTPAHSLMAGAAAVLVVGLLAATFAVFSHRSAPHRSSVGAPPAATATHLPTVAAAVPYVPNANDILSAIQMLSPTEGWAVGDSYTENAQHTGGTQSCLVVHFSNGEWTRVSTPTDAELGVHDAFLQSISMVSSDEGWAVGSGIYSGTSSRIPPSGLILHYSAGKWTKASITPNAEFYSIQMLSPTDGWAAGGGGWGTGGPATTSILWHYDGSRWTSVPVPNVTGITSLDMLSASDGWATGTDAILHYDGTQWKIYAQLQGILGVSMDSASDGWAFGYVDFQYNFPSSYNEVWHFDGSQWVREPLPGSVNAGASILGLSMDSAADGWAVGFGNGQKYGKRYSLYLHYTNGRWTAVQGPGNDNLDGVFMISAQEGWAVGTSGVLLHYRSGAWTRYQP